MPYGELGEGAKQGKGENSNANVNTKAEEEEMVEEEGRGSSSKEKRNLPLLSVVIAQPEEITVPKGSVSKSTALGPDKDDKASVATLKKGCLIRSESYDEQQCRVCQQKTEEDLMDLGCRCRGDLAKAHRSCIDIWFHSKGSNKCEICQCAAANVPFPESQPSTNYWVWRVDPASGQSNNGRGEQERRCCSPLWIAFTVLIAGLLLDVIISVSLGVSALPVNIIIGILIVLGVGTALRLALECCHGWSLRRNFQSENTTANPDNRPSV